MRAVLDTNVIVSAFVFRGRLRPIWTAIVEQRLTPVLCTPTFDELARVIAYRKFKLSAPEQRVFLQSFVQGSDVTASPEIDANLAALCRDVDDRIFIALAVRENIPLVSGDRDLDPLRALGAITVISPADLVRMLG